MKDFDQEKVAKTDTLEDVMLFEQGSHLAYLVYEAFENIIADEAKAETGREVEVWGTGGGCTAIVATDGTTDVVMTTMDGYYLLCVYRATDEYPEPHAWYPEQMVSDTDLPNTLTAQEAADAFAAKVNEFLA